MSDEVEQPVTPEAEKYQELTEEEFNIAAEFFIKEDGAYEKVTKTGDHAYEKGKYFKEKEPQEQQSSTGAGPAASEVTEGPATPAVTGGVLSKEQIDTATTLAATIVRDPKFIAAATSATAAEGDGPKAANSGGRRRTKRKQQKKGGKSAKKGGKKHRKSSGKKSRRSSSKKSRRQGRK